MASGNSNDLALVPIESGATQAMEVIVETTSDTNTLPTFYGGPARDDIPADEMTLSIDHIREQLFSLLTPKDLFKCRRLNRMWNSYVTVELHELIEVQCKIKEETLEEYLNLLQKHQEMFPCLPLPIFRKYSFEKDTSDIMCDPMLQQFLRTYGYFIRDLSLKQISFCYMRDSLPKEKDVMEFVRSLLIHSTPNLSSLRMDNVRYNVDWKENSSYDYEDFVRTLRTTDPEFDEIHSIPDTEKNENLKFLSLTSISGKILELAVQLAPNLEEVQVRSRCHGDHKYFIAPLNRLRLCKDIKYTADSSNVFKKFGDPAHEGNLKLRDISFMLGMGNLNPTDDDLYLRDAFYELYDDADVDAITKILASSWDSLETITWRWVMAVPGLKWPDVMPNVSRINLGPLNDTLEDGLLAFPPDFSWSKTFPRLRVLHFCEVIDSLGFQQLLQCFKNRCLDSVEEVHIFERNSEERDATTVANWEQLRRLFPTAQFLSSWPFTNFDSTSTSTDSDDSDDDDDSISFDYDGDWSA